MQVRIFRYHESVSPIEYSTLHIYYPGKWILSPICSHSALLRSAKCKGRLYLFLATVKDCSSHARYASHSHVCT